MKRDETENNGSFSVRKRATLIHDTGEQNKKRKS
jgi:hypothetical protein